MVTGPDGDLNELISDIEGQRPAVSLTTLADHYHDWVLQLIESEPGDAIDAVAPQRVYHGGHGRPPYHIPQSQLEALIELRFTYEKIAKLLNVSLALCTASSYAVQSSPWMLSY